MSQIENPVSNNIQPAKLQCRELNDQFRKTFLGGTIVVTQGVQALDNNILDQLMPAIQSFDAFTTSNNPLGEHDFGEVKINGTRVWFKIDTYDNDMRYMSSDPSDPNVTKRVMTLMLPEEY